MIKILSLFYMLTLCSALSAQNVYRAPSGFVNFDSARQSQIETQWSERGSHSKTMADEEDRFGKVAASQNSQNLTERGIEGFWKRINSKTGNTQCVISIYKHQDKYYGRIIGTFDADGKMKENLYAPEDRAEKVSGSPYYCGMDLLWDLQENGTKYRGKIVDPRSGKIYNAAIWNKDGNLIVRGELFFLGKNEIWYPIEDDDFPKEFKKPDLTQFIPVIPEKSLKEPGKTRL